MAAFPEVRRWVSARLIACDLCRTWRRLQPVQYVRSASPHFANYDVANVGFYVQLPQHRASDGAARIPPCRGKAGNRLYCRRRGERCAWLHTVGAGVRILLANPVAMTLSARANAWWKATPPTRHTQHCANCRQFTNDPLRIEAEFPGL